MGKDIHKIRVFVSGSAGSIGNELVRQYAAEGHSVYCYDLNDTVNFDLIEELKLLNYDVSGQVGDIRDLESVRQAVEKFEPDLIAHCAALKVVTSSEKSPVEYTKTNVIGLHNVITATNNIKGVFISTDKAVNRFSIMGATKYIGEAMARNAGWVTVRFANVVGSNGSVVPLWQNQIRRGQPMTVTSEKCERYMMEIADAVELVREAADKGKPGQTFIMDMGDPVNIYQLALEVREAMGAKDHPIKMIGLRPGETLTERLMTEEEEGRATKEGKFWVL